MLCHPREGGDLLLPTKLRLLPTISSSYLGAVA